MDLKKRLELGDFKAIIELSKDSQNAADLEFRAYALQKTAKYEQAMSVWNQLIARIPEVASFYNERGVCKFHLKS